MFYEDLSQYCCADSSTQMLHVGWLGRGHAYSNQRVLPESVVLKLKKLAECPENVCRGYHYCDLCEVPTWAQDDPARADVWDIPRRGNGEIHVVIEGVVYSAPTLIIHYITDHGYSPPEAFVDAVRSLDMLQLRRASLDRETRSLAIFAEDDERS